MKADTWMPLYVRDWDDKTRHLDCEQDGAYGRLVRHYWKSGTALPDDDAQLARIIGMDRARWKKVRPLIEPFFRVEEGKWRHERVEEEITKARVLIEKRRAAGSMGGRPRKCAPDLDESNEKPNGLANGKQTETPARVALPSPSPASIEALSCDLADKPPGEPDARDAFDEWNALAERLGLPTARDFTPARAAKLRTRLKAGGIEAWRDALRAVEASPFCRGLKTEFRADLDFLLQPSKFQRLVEGYYAAPSAKPAGIRAAQPITPEILSNRLQRYADTGEWLETWGPRPEKAA